MPFGGERVNLHAASVAFCLLMGNTRISIIEIIKMAAASPSTRRTTRESGRFTRSTPGSQALERGLQLLRVFRPGVSALTNAQLADRTGLARPTVSRLTRSLVESGFLAYDVKNSAYRLTAVYLSLALAFTREQDALDIALPLMRRVADEENLNVGLAVADQLDMVYVDAVRRGRLVRNIVPGLRIPMEATSLGWAYLARIPGSDREALMRRLSQSHGPAWPIIEAQIAKELAEFGRLGYCSAVWRTGMVALAAPLWAPHGEVQALNITLPVESDLDATVSRYSTVILDLARDIQNAWDAARMLHLRQ